MSPLGDRVEGILFGIAAGDTVGTATEMALCVAESVLSREGFDSKDVGGRYLAWWQDGGFDDGPVFEAVLSLVNSGLPFDKASVVVHERLSGQTSGCTPVIRALPLAMMTSLVDEQLPNIAKTDASLTHRHPLAGDVTAASVVLCRALIRGADWNWALQVAERGRMPDTRNALKEPAYNLIRSDGFAPDVLATSVRILNGCASFREALACSLEFSEPLGYCPTLVGAIGGARWGRSAIPDNLLSHAEHLLPRIQAVTDECSASWITSRTASRGATPQ